MPAARPAGHPPASPKLFISAAACPDQVSARPCCHHAGPGRDRTGPDALLPRGGWCPRPGPQSWTLEGRDVMGGSAEGTGRRLSRQLSPSHRRGQQVEAQGFAAALGLDRPGVDRPGHLYAIDPPPARGGHAHPVEATPPAHGATPHHPRPRLHPRRPRPSSAPGRGHLHRLLRNALSEAGAGVGGCEWGRRVPRCCPWKWEVRASGLSA